MGDGDSLNAITDRVKSGFSERQSLLTFAEFLDLFHERPYVFSRCAAQYLVDAIDAGGKRTVQRFGQGLERFELFDRGRPDGSGRVAGHEEAAESIHRLMLNFARQGYADRLVLLYGPNGSAKTSIVDSLFRCLEDYSRTTDGAVYRFEWIFPQEKVYRGGTLGFSGGGAQEDGEPDSFARLDEGDIAAVIQCELRDSPLFLLPAAERQALLAERFPDARLSERFPLPAFLLNNDLCPKCRQIFDALLTSYRGDLSRVLKHIRVRRYDLSRGYRLGAVSVHPQISVDARLAQVTADAGYAALPPALRSLPFFVPLGELIDANHGMIEYDDLLKRPAEAFKYLLTTAETQTLALENHRLSLDLVMIGTANDRHLEAFKATPQLDFASFKGRLELIRVPYLLRPEDERQIYELWVDKASAGKHRSPHAVELASLWAVLTRLRRPDPDRYEGELAAAVRELEPLDKARLYDQSLVPEKLSPEDARALKRAVRNLRAEHEGSPDYEGRFGASPREIKTVLLNASQRREYPCLSPLAVFEELEALCRDESVYEFLQLKPQGGYHDAAGLVEVCRAVYVDCVDDEFKEAVEFVDEARVDEMFERYVLHVTHTLKGEKLPNPVTGKSDDPDAELMREMEQRLASAGESEDFRNQLVSAIGAHGIDHPDEELSYREVFPDLFEQLEDNLFQELAGSLRKACRAVLALLEKGKGLDDEERALAERVVSNLTAKFGYCESCAAEAISLLLKERYSESS